MAKAKSKANDPQEEKKEEVLETAHPLEGDSRVIVENKIITEGKNYDKTKGVTKDSEDIPLEVKEETDYGTYEIPKLLAELEKLCKEENWNSQNKKIQGIIHLFELKISLLKYYSLSLSSILENFQFC